jgi:RimJ/RimL family protein N-acetyltransferase
MIRGNSIYLRALEREDLSRCHAWINDEEVTAALAAHHPISLARETDWLERAVRGEDPSQVHLAICLAEGDRHIGNCGLVALDRENRTATLGIVIGEKDCWRRGYGTDAVRTLCRYGFDELNLHKIRLDVYAFNEGAATVYERVGFRREGVLRKEIFRNGRYHDVIRMGLFREELNAGR